MIEDLAEIVDPFGVFDLGDDLDRGVGLVQDLLDCQDVLPVADKGVGDKVQVVFSGKA